MTDNPECTTNEENPNMFTHTSEDLENIRDRDRSLAETCQREFNKEFKLVKIEINKNSHECVHELDDVDDDTDVYDSEEWEKLEVIERRLLPICPRGYKSEIKHSVELNKSKNGYKLLTFPPAFQMIHRSKCKNFKNFDVVPAPSKYKSTMKEKHSVNPVPTYCESKMDSYGCFIIKRLIYNQVLKRVNDVVNIGRSSNIFHAHSNSLYPLSNKHLPKICAIKVFKSIAFGGGYEYGTSKESLQLLGQREMMGLKKLEEIVNCPQLVTHKKHVVVMSFIGKIFQPAPKIKDVKFNTKENIALYNEIIDSMKKMYEKGKLVHGCLSESNILWHKQQCYFINFKHCVETHEQNAHNLLYADCTNITNFFLEKNVPCILTADGLFQHITGCSYEEFHNHEDKTKFKE